MFAQPLEKGVSEMDPRKRQVYIGIHGNGGEVFQCTYEAWETHYKLLGYDMLGAAPIFDGFERMVPGDKPEYRARLVTAAR